MSEEGIDRWFMEQLVPVDDDLALVRAAASAAGLDDHDVAPLQARFLQLIAGAMGARRVLEVGTLAGVSALAFARAGASVVTIEADEHAAGVATRSLAEVGADVEVRVGSSADVVPGLEGPFDLVFLDGDKARLDEDLRLVLPLCRDGALIVADNVVRGGQVLRPGSDERADGVRRFVELVAADARLEATALQTVGIKGWDGMAFVRVLPASS